MVLGWFGEVIFLVPGNDFIMFDLFLDEVMGLSQYC